MKGANISSSSKMFYYCGSKKKKICIEHLLYAKHIRETCVKAFHQRNHLLCQRFIIMFDISKREF